MKLRFKSLFNDNARYLYSQQELESNVFISMMIGFILATNVGVLIVQPHNIQSFVITLVVGLSLFLLTPFIGFWIFMNQKYQEKEEG